MSDRHIVLDKRPGVSLVGVGTTWRCLFSKSVMRFKGPEATNACQGFQLYPGLKVGIGGAVHGFQYILDANLSSEYWVFLLVDKNNVFNKIKRSGMLWEVPHLWPSRAHFILDCYRHW